MKKIEMYPITDVTTIFENLGYWEQQEENKKLKDATIGVHFIDEEPINEDVHLYNTSVVPFKHYDHVKRAWTETLYKCKSEFALHGGTIVWEKP
ncbi:hypothetical protein ACX818_001333 [Acinetobacter baumannii]